MPNRQSNAVPVPISDPDGSRFFRRSRIQDPDLKNTDPGPPVFALIYSKRTGTIKKCKYLKIKYGISAINLLC